MPLSTAFSTTNTTHDAHRASCPFDESLYEQDDDGDVVRAHLVSQPSPKRFLDNVLRRC